MSSLPATGFPDMGVMCSLGFSESACEEKKLGKDKETFMYIQVTQPGACRLM